MCCFPFRYSNDVSAPVIQSLKKKCNPSLKTKTFKERNPDLDMEEIQNNPNIPDDIKAVLSGSVLDEAEGMEEPVECLKDGVEAMIQEKYDDIFNEDSDEEMIRSRRGRKNKKDDDDWFATKKERLDREKKINPKPRGRPKRKSDDGNDDKVKRKKHTPKKKDELSTPKKKDDVTTPKKKSTDNAKTSSEKSKAAKKPPALPFNLLDLSKKFEGKIPSLKNQSNDVETAKKVVVEMLPQINVDQVKSEKSSPTSNASDVASPFGMGNSFTSSTVTSSNNSLTQTPSTQNGPVLQARTTLSSTISSKDVKPSEITQSKYSLKV